MDLSINIQEDKIFAAVTGRIDTSTSPLFEERMQPLLENANKEIELDLQGLTYISSAGLRLFLILQKKVSTAGGKLVLRHMANDIANVFKMTGFSKIFNIVD